MKSVKTSILAFYPPPACLHPVAAQWSGSKQRAADVWVCITLDGCLIGRHGPGRWSVNDGYPWLLFCSCMCECVACHMCVCVIFYIHTHSTFSSSRSRHVICHVWILPQPCRRYLCCGIRSEKRRWDVLFEDATLMSNVSNVSRGFFQVKQLSGFVSNIYYFLWCFFSCEEMDCSPAPKTNLPSGKIKFTLLFSTLPETDSARLLLPCGFLSHSILVSLSHSYFPQCETHFLMPAIHPLSCTVSLHLLFSIISSH